MKFIEKQGDKLLVLSFATSRDLTLPNRLKPEGCGIRGVVACHNLNPLLH